MRGYAKWNFPAFDAVRDRWKAGGWSVISPADLDRACGLDENSDAPLPADFIRKAMLRDMTAILLHCDAIVLLPGWEKSKGANAEKALAEAIGIEVFEEVAS